MAAKSLRLTAGELVSRLRKFNPLAKVVVMTTHDEGDDVTDWEIVDVHDHWTLKKEHDLVSIEIDLDQRPEFYGKQGAVKLDDIDLRGKKISVEARVLIHRLAFALGSLSDEDSGNMVALMD